MGVRKRDGRPWGTIADAVRVARRYVRSIDLVRDATDPAALDGYVATPTVRDATRRVLAGLAAGSTQRAFRITGPYGSGKSAFGLFVARLAAESAGINNPGPASRIAAGIGAPLPEGFPAYTPVVVVGRRARLADAVLEAIAVAAAGRALGRRCAATAKAAATLAVERAAGSRDDAAVLDLLESYARRGVQRARGGRPGGVLVLIDEMGRFLEHVSLNRYGEDPSFIQSLAERAGGAAAAPVAVVAFLHHRFAEYAEGLGRSAEAEWSRTAERFEEVTFHGSTEQTLFLLGQALEHDPALTAFVGSAARKLLVEAGARGLFSTDIAELEGVAPRLYPLHPAAVAALAQLGRRFGQNERSVFSFLQTLEPAGFQHFVRERAPDSGEWYRVHDLFDYLAAQGPGRMPSADRERRWALALEAAAQACDMPVLDAAAVRCVGLLAALEPVPGLRPDALTVAWCLAAEVAETEAALGRLCAAGLLYRRPHRDDYSLWSSSSVDLDGWLERAWASVPPTARLSAALEGLGQARPVIAHRHYHRTGSLRAFRVVAWDGTGAPPADPDGECDGAVVVVPVHPGETAAGVAARHAAAIAIASPLVLFCLKRVSPADLKAAHELALWKWIDANCPELRIDDTARREVRARVAAAEEAVSEAVRPFADLGASADETWMQGGKEVEVGSRKDLSLRLSQTCDEVFRLAPVVKNELVNRPRLSSAAATARMRLLELMVQAGAVPELGIAGTPAEKAIYLSVLRSSGLHRDLGGGRWGFAPPSPDPSNWLPAWRRVTALLRGGKARALPELLDGLAAPPIWP